MLALPLRAPYCSTKFAVNGFFDALHIEEPELAITLFCPGTITGSNFRNNLLTGSIPQSTSKNTITVEQAAQLCIAGSDRRIRNVIVPQLGYTLVHLNNLYPAGFEGYLRREAKL
jgi:short-subunit dehydrogenase